MATPRYVSKDTKTLLRGRLRKEGTTVYASTIPQKVGPADDDLIYTAREGDRFETLAYRFYGSVRYWYAIASVNGYENGGLAVPPGTQLRIPSRVRIVGS